MITETKVKLPAGGVCVVVYFPAALKSMDGDSAEPKPLGKYGDVEVTAPPVLVRAGKPVQENVPPVVAAHSQVGVPSR